MTRFDMRRGVLRVTLTGTEVAFLRTLPEQLRELYEAPIGDPARDRLFPRAYLDPGEEGAEREWQELVHPGLVHERLDALEQLVRDLAESSERRGRHVVELDPEHTGAWLGVLNDARLALGVRLGVKEDEPLRVDPGAPEADAAAAYLWLTETQAELVDALLS